MSHNRIKYTLARAEHKKNDRQIQQNDEIMKNKHTHFERKQN